MRRQKYYIKLKILGVLVFKTSFKIAFLEDANV